MNLLRADSACSGHERTPGDRGGQWLAAPLHEIDALASAIEQLQRRPEEPERMGLLAKQRAEREFTPDVMAAGYEKALFHWVWTTHGSLLRRPRPRQRRSGVTDVSRSEAAGRSAEARAA